MMRWDECVELGGKSDVQLWGISSGSNPRTLIPFSRNRSTGHQVAIPLRPGKETHPNLTPPLVFSKNTVVSGILENLKKNLSIIQGAANPCVGNNIPAKVSPANSGIMIFSLVSTDTIDTGMPFCIALSDIHWAAVRAFPVPEK